MSVSRPGTFYTSPPVRHGEFASPSQAVQRKKKRCLEPSRKEHVFYTAHVDSGGYQVRQLVSADGLPYFCYGQTISPDNLTNPTVFSAFMVASRELTQYLTALNTHLGRFEVVITLQCVAPMEPRFCYYFVDHHLRRVSNESNIIDINHGALSWNLMDRHYWDHVAIFSAHRNCTSAEYDMALALLDGEAIALIDTGDVNIPNDFETLRNLLTLFNRTHIDKHATASIAKVMKRILPPPPAPPPESRDTPSLGSTILSSLRGIILSEDRRKSQDGEDDAHPIVHEDPLEGVPLASSLGTEEDTGNRIGWDEYEEQRF